MDPKRLCGISFSKASDNDPGDLHTAKIEGEITLARAVDLLRNVIHYEYDGEGKEIVRAVFDVGMRNAYDALLECVIKVHALPEIEPAGENIVSE